MNEGLLYDVSKKDDDARLVRDREGVIYLETTENLGPAAVTVSSTPPPPSAASTLIEDSASQPAVDVRVQVVQNMFLAHMLLMLATLLLGTPFYFMQAPRMALVIVLVCVMCAGFPLSYALMLWWRKSNVQGAAIAYLAWCMNFIVAVGCVAHLAGNVAVFQWVAVVWAQSIAVIVYAKLTPRGNMYTSHAMLYMAFASLIVWGISIALFYVDHDWLSAGLVLGFAALCIVYHGHEMRACEARYNASWEDAALSVVQFYGDPVLYVVAALDAK
jgi:hypothetical protein